MQMFTTYTLDITLEISERNDFCWIVTVHTTTIHSKAFATQCEPQTSCITLDLLQNNDYKLFWGAFPKNN